MNCLIRLRILLVFNIILYTSVDYVSSQDASSIVLTIENKEIPVSEYINFVTRNDPDGAKTNKENSDDFIDYQLKLHEARVNGYDTADKYIEDLAMYREFLATDYLAFNKLGENQVEEYYARILKEIKISHIRVDIEGDLYRDTLSAYRKIDSLYRLIQAGENFNVLAHEFSDGPS
ncbi:peptidylprolyl isomerase, partial [Bacteroidota bacterium]